MSAAARQQNDDIEPLRLCGDDALLIVDLQCDFLPGGSLGVPGGDAVIAPLNDCIARFATQRLPVFASRDWHPTNHCSFRDAGGPWPPHCVARTPGAHFAPALRLPADAIVISKATTRERDSYSAFGGTELHARLREHGVSRLLVGGLTTDYCVRATVLDALGLGYRVVVLVDAVAAVGAQAGDSALQQMRDAGATLATTRALG